MAAAAAASGATAAVESVVVVHNVAKRHNVGTLARSATAFGVAEVVVVGRRDVSAFGSHGSTSHLRFRHFTSLATACAYLKDERGCDICGVEITDDALPVTAHPFRRSTAFLFGNEGHPDGDYSTSYSRHMQSQMRHRRAFNHFVLSILCRVQDSHKRSVRSVTSSSTSLSMVAELHHSMLPLQHQLFSTTSGSGLAFLKEGEKAINLW
ncbi:uncharacterized protein LOC119324094 isoform X3 [Triticum dicoccoides]|uniref:uncharacterized protein LOC119324094 isoform X3 n=1 Tax=Triticum dicoccoides TaxID=85692 RepID=UPI00188E2524|nr:uncharacterized protein LOC119324094 isoform X3 [Triticum dicoccoides]